jgi:hypothetical protein
MKHVDNKKVWNLIEDYSKAVIRIFYSTIMNFSCFYHKLHTRNSCRSFIKVFILVGLLVQSKQAW